MFIYHEQDVTQGQFLAEFNKYEFRVLLFLVQLPYHGFTLQYILLFIHLLGRE